MQGLTHFGSQPWGGGSVGSETGSESLEASRWELICLLRSTGWKEQEVLPRSRQAPYQLDGSTAKVWYYWKGSGRLLTQYLLALCYADALATAGATHIDHNKAAAYYETLLDMLPLSHARPTAAKRRKHAAPGTLVYCSDSSQEATVRKRARRVRLHSGPPREEEPAVGEVEALQENVGPEAGGEEASHELAAPLLGPVPPSLPAAVAAEALAAGGSVFDQGEADLRMVPPAAAERGEAEEADEGQWESVGPSQAQVLTPTHTHTGCC